MLDIHLEPDDDFEYEEMECDDDFDFDDEPTERDIEIAVHNYECLVYNEPERRIWR